MKADSRFEVDLKGFRELQAGREVWRLVKELVTNVFDEVNRLDVERRPRYCTVVVDPVPNLSRVRVEVEDDGQGFQALADAFTLFRSTPKRGQAQVAGRFNLGEKEIMAAALEGGIETTSGTVEFPAEGGRKVYPRRKRTHGTRVWAVLPATRQEFNACITMLRRMMAPGSLQVRVNGMDVLHREPLGETLVTLQTVIQEAPHEPLRKTYRQTEVVVYGAEADGEGWLYELGCPIQPIASAYSADVRQKVPMPPERDTVSDWYLQDVYAAIANAVTDDLGEEDAAATWVKTALEDSDVKDETVRKVVQLRHGDKVILWSSNQEANERAMDAGYVVVPRTALSAVEKAAYERAGVQRASDVFRRQPAAWEVVEPTETMERIAKYARAIAGAVLEDDTISVLFFRQAGNPDAAEWNGSKHQLAFNVSTLGLQWFRNIRPEVTGVILHEFAHEGSDGETLPHGKEYIDRLSLLAGQLTHRLLWSGQALVELLNCISYRDDEEV